MPEPRSKQSNDTTRAEREAIDSLWRAELREAWNRKGHDGWLTQTWGKPGNQRLRVYLALIIRGVDWGNPDWPLLEEQRLFYEPDADEHADTEETEDYGAGTPEGYRSNPWHDGLAGGVCGLALALGAALSLGWIHL